LRRSFRPPTANVEQPLQPRERPDPKQARENFLKKVLESGPPEPWSRQAEVAFDKSVASLPAEVRSGVHWGSMRCASSGCVVDATCANRGVSRQLEELLAMRTVESPIRDWQGDVRRSAEVELENGELIATWALMKPNQ
jgi:hypothetical protein